MKFCKILIIFFTSMSLFSCAFKNIESYSEQLPKLDISKYFSGNTEAYGMLQDRSGKVTRRFTVKMFGVYKDNVLTLNEVFTFDDGEKQNRDWVVTFKDGNNFTAKAGDVIGIASGKQFGNAVSMSYVLRIPYNGSTIDVSVDDWMYLIDEKSLINVSKINKFGFNVAKLTIGFRKL